MARLWIEPPLEPPEDYYDDHQDIDFSCDEEEKAYLEGYIDNIFIFEIDGGVSFHDAETEVDEEIEIKFKPYTTEFNIGAIAEIDGEKLGLISKDGINYGIAVVYGINGKNYSPNELLEKKIKELL